MNDGCEEGARMMQFLTQTIRKTERINANHATRKAEELRRTNSEPGFAYLSGIEKPVQDHGCIIPSLHDLHKHKMGVKAPPRQEHAILKLPPVPLNAQPNHASWFWPGGHLLPQDVESAVTMAAPSAVASQVAPSALSAAASQLQQEPLPLGERRRRSQQPDAEQPLRQQRKSAPALQPVAEAGGLAASAKGERRMPHWRH